MYELSDEEAKKTKMGCCTTLYYFKEMGEHPASGYLLATVKPILIMQGEKDFQATAEKDSCKLNNLDLFVKMPKPPLRTAFGYV